jgi:hypothetical protein
MPIAHDDPHNRSDEPNTKQTDRPCKGVPEKERLRKPSPIQRSGMRLTLIDTLGENVAPSAWRRKLARTRSDRCSFKAEADCVLKTIDGLDYITTV